MLFAGDAALQKAVMSSRRYPREKVEVDWNRNGLYDHAYSDISAYVIDWEVSREITTDLPESATLLEGFVISSVTLTLGGKRKTSDPMDITELLSQYLPASPLFRMPIVASPNVRVTTGYDVEGGTRWMQQFEGPLRIHELDSMEGVKTEGLDPSDRHRTPVTLPQWINQQDEYLDYDRYVTIHTGWVVDFALRRQGVYASDPLNGRESMSITLHGGLPAEIGTCKGLLGTNPNAETRWTKDPRHPLGVASSPAMFGSRVTSTYIYSDNLWGWDPGQTVTFAHWVYIPQDDEWTGTGGNWQYWRIESSARSDSDYFYVGFSVAESALIFGVNMVEGRDRLAIPLTAAMKGTWQWIACQWKIESATTYNWCGRVGGKQAYYTQNPRALPGSVSPILSKSSCVYYLAFTSPMSDVRVWLDEPYKGADPYPWAEYMEGFVSTQVDHIDLGSNELLYLPDKVNRDCFELIKEAVGAEYGLVGYNQFGKFYFTERTRRVQVTNEPVRTITAHESLKKLAFNVSADNIRNIVTTDTATRWGEWTAIYEAQTVRQFAFGVGRTVFPIELEWGRWSSSRLDRVINRNGLDVRNTENTGWESGWGDWSYDGYQAYSALLDGNGAPLKIDNITVDFRTITDRTGELIVVNNSDQPGMFKTSDGASPNPAFRLWGYKLTDAVSVINTYASPGSRMAYDDRVLELAGSEWRHLARPMGEVATTLKNDLKNSYPVFDAIPIVGDHRLQEGDVVMVADPLKLLPPIRCKIVKILRKGSKGNGYEDEITCKPISPPGLGIFNDPTDGILGETLVLGP